MAKILVVEDEEPIQYLLRQILEPEGHKCCLASNAAQARECLKGEAHELILCDINMPGESGLDFIRYALSEHPSTAAVMVTAINDPLVAEEALEIGVYNYLVKPFRRNEVLITVANALRRRELEIANLAYREDLEKIVEERTAAVQVTMEKLRKALDGTVNAVALTVESRDPYTAGHQRRVSKLACAIARELGLSEGHIEAVRMAGIIHDLGKISVPAGILSKPLRLSDNEFNLIKEHPQAGYDILREIDFPWPIAQIVMQHHERMDGSGYPKGLPGGEILPEAKILAVADVVEAMASHRPYRAALGINRALREISSNREILYDAQVVEICLRLFTKKGFSFLKD